MAATTARELVSAPLHRAVVSTRSTLAAQVITVPPTSILLGICLLREIILVWYHYATKMVVEWGMNLTTSLCLAVAAGLHEAERRAFVAYWTQRLCITNQKGIAKVLDKMRPISTATPHVLEQGTLNTGVPNARPLGKLAPHASARRPGEGNNTTWGGLVIAA